MEMNTRLQVEHPVTEAITGIDLVEWQLRVASGESLPLRQEDLTITGHAFEARLYAEDVAAGFLPATGRLAYLAFPGGARVETGVRAGDAISPWYDPMIAKIITHGPTRGAALGQMERALAATEVAGSVTNLSFLLALTRHPGFAAGQVDTGLIGRDLAGLLAVPPVPPEYQALAVLAAAGLDGAGDGMRGFALWQPLRQTVVLEAFSALVEVLGPARVRVTIGEAVLDCEHRGEWWVNGQKLRARLVRHGSGHGAGVSVFGTATFHAALHDPLERASDGPASGLTLSPMPGLVKAVFVAAGEAVRAGDRLAVLEAMKMEHTLTAARDGRVAEVLVAAGAQVEAGAALIRLEEEA
jgi:3-methylcrotonyl-CoA carboxylase alpha subunit